MEPAVAGVIVVPLFVVHGDPHFWWITVVKAITAAEVFLSPEILGIVHVWVMVKPVPVTEIGLSTPGTAISTLVGRSMFGQSRIAAGQYGGDQKMTKHHCVPPRDVRNRQVEANIAGFFLANS